MTGPQVSVGIPVFNGERFIEASVRSVCAQSLEDLEILISDNGSTDGTPDILRKLAESDDRIKLTLNPVNRGAAWNYNQVFASASGEYFRWHAHDDLLEPTAVERCVAALQNTPGAVLAHTYTRFIDDEGDELRRFADNLGIGRGAPAARLSSVMRRLTYCNAVFGVIDRHALSTTALIAPFPGSDVTLLYELSLRGTFVAVPEYLFARRPGNSLRTNTTRAALSAWFDPSRTRRGPIAVQHAVATAAAISHSGLGRSQQTAAYAALTGVWPLQYGKRVVRRRRRAGSPSR